MPRELLFVVNPNAANGRLGRAWPDMVRRMRDALGAFDFEETQGPGDASRIARGAARAGYRTVVSVGGDGTNNEVVNGLLDEERPINDVTLGVLPFGTGGDFRRLLAGSGSFEAAIDRLRRAPRRRVDLGRVDFIDHAGAPATRYFLNVASFGIGGLVDQIVNSSSKRLGGTLTFLIASVRALLRYTFPRVELQIDDGPIVTCPIFNVFVANGQYCGGGMHVAPQAALDDGRFDIVLAREAPLRWLLLRGGEIYKGRHLRQPWVSLHHGACVEARPLAGAEVLLDIDGEAPGRLPATLRLLPGALTMCID